MLEVLSYAVLYASLVQSMLDSYLLCHGRTQCASHSSVLEVLCMLAWCNPCWTAMYYENLHPLKLLQ